MIIEKKFQANKSGFLIYNDQVAKDIAESIVDFITPGSIIVSYHYKEDVVLIHPGYYFGRKGACSAMKQLLKAIESEDIHCDKNDERIRNLLNEPEFSTKAVLSNFLREELRKAK